jgi:hypothetical protein
MKKLTCSPVMTIWISFNVALTIPHLRSKVPNATLSPLLALTNAVLGLDAIAFPMLVVYSDHELALHSTPILDDSITLPVTLATISRQFNVCVPPFSLMNVMVRN